MSKIIRNRTAAVAAWTRLVRLHQRIDALSEGNFRSLGLNSAWFDVLARIGANEGLCQADLAASLLVTKGNVSQLLAKMVEADLVDRRPDGRSQRLFLTEAGRELHNRAVPQQEALLGETLGGLSGEEQRALLGLLRKWEASCPR